MIVDDKRVFTGRVVTWDSLDKRLMKGEAMIHIIVRDQDIRDGLIPFGRFIIAAEARGES